MNASTSAETRPIKGIERDRIQVREGHFRRIDENLYAGEKVFSRWRCFAFDDGAEDLLLIRAIERHLLRSAGDLAIYGASRICRYLLDHSEQLTRKVEYIVDDDPEYRQFFLNGVPVIPSAGLPSSARTVFLATRRWRNQQEMRRKLPASVRVVTIDVLEEIARDLVPERAWVPRKNSIYPIDIPEISFEPGQEMILVDFPARTINMPPIGFNVVHDALKKTGIALQTVDLDVILYHRFHSHRILDGNDPVLTPAGEPMPDEPWNTLHYTRWQEPDFLDWFEDDLAEIIDKLVAARPRIIGISLQQVNHDFATRVAEGVRRRYPEVVFVVGGMSCTQDLVGRFLFPEADYLVVGEADLTVGPLVESILAGEKPRDLPGVISRDDTPGRQFARGELPMALDEIDFPKYEFTDIDLYRNHNNHSVVPIVASRGCVWSKCTFCAERFLWRARSPKHVTDEMEWWYRRGREKFVFSDSDFNGRPQQIMELCEEIIRRGIDANLSGQLRIHREIDEGYCRKLAEAGFENIRFGVDAWSEHTMKLQRKGYNKEIVRQNLRACHAAGLPVMVNSVIGIPGETEEDIDESIEFLVEMKPYISQIGYIHPLLLNVGSVYWEEPEKHNIHFLDDKEKLYGQYAIALPDDKWYSTEPYIDVDIRYARLLKLADALRENGFTIPYFAEHVIEKAQRRETILEERAKTRKRIADFEKVSDMRRVTR